MKHLLAVSSYGIKNAIAHNVLIDEKGQPWAIEYWHVYAKRHGCINLYEVKEYNSQTEMEILVDELISKKVK
mgnify:FL=1